MSDLGSIRDPRAMMTTIANRLIIKIFRRRQLQNFYEAALAHGGIVLGPRSAVKIDVNAEREEVCLLSRELFLETTTPRRLPLTLTAGHWTIRPSQGRVTVRHRDPVLSAVALDGGREIEFSNLPSLWLNAQKSLSLAGGRLIEADADVAREVAWSKGLLVMKDGHFAGVVRSLELYFVEIIRVSPSAAAIQTGGVFKLSEPHATLFALAEARRIVVREVPPVWIDIRAAA